MMSPIDVFKGTCDACGGKRDISEVESIQRNGMRIWVCKSYQICQWRNTPRDKD